MTAEDEKIAAETEQVRIETEVTRVQLALDEMKLERERLKHERLVRDENEVRATEDWQRIYRLDTGIHASTVSVAVNTLREWHLTTELEQPFELVINSPGGSVFDGFELGDVIERIQDEGRVVIGRVSGIAASMAGALLQYCGHRIIGRNSYLHLHEVSTGALGKASELEDASELAKRLTLDICNVYADRSGGDAEEIHDWIKRQERYLSAAEALERGFCDEIG